MKEDGRNSQVRKAVIAEVESWKKTPRAEGDTWHSELNNFHDRLACVFYEEAGGRQLGILVEAAGIWDTPNHITHTTETDKAKHSPLYLRQTPRELFESIDTVVEELPDISYEIINELQCRHYALSNLARTEGMTLENRAQMQDSLHDSLEALRQLYNYTLAVYVELRVKGYSHFDLTG